MRFSNSYKGLSKVVLPPSPGTVRATASGGAAKAKRSKGLVAPRSRDPGVRRSMQANKRADTSPEIGLRSELHRRGMRFRKDLRIDLGGRFVRPDIVFPRQRIAIFVDGCFWHCCPDHLARPKSNVEYWTAKLEGNVARDRSNDAFLKEHGWQSIRAWEHEEPASVADRVQAALGTH